MEFWDDGHRTVEDVRRHYFYRSNVKSWIAHVNGHPLAYVQMYLISEDSPFSQWKCPQKTTIGIDLFIGEVALISKGLSAPLIHAFVNQCLQGYMPCRLLVDPSAQNVRALRAYRKAGFSDVGSLKTNETLSKILIKDF